MPELHSNIERGDYRLALRELREGGSLSHFFAKLPKALQCLKISYSTTLKTEWNSFATNIIILNAPQVIDKIDNIPYENREEHFFTLVMAATIFAQHALIFQIYNSENNYNYKIFQFTRFITSIEQLLLDNNETKDLNNSPIRENFELLLAISWWHLYSMETPFLQLYRLRFTPAEINNLIKNYGDSNSTKAEIISSIGTLFDKEIEKHIWSESRPDDNKTIEERIEFLKESLEKNQEPRVDLITTKEVAELLEKDKSTVNRLRREGKLQYIKEERNTFYYDKKAITEYKNSRK